MTVVDQLICVPNHPEKLSVVIDDELALGDWSINADGTVTGVLQVGSGKGAPPPLVVYGSLSSETRRRLAGDAKAMATRTGGTRLHGLADPATIALSLVSSDAWVPVSSAVALDMMNLNGSFLIQPDGDITVHANGAGDEVNLVDGSLRVRWYVHAAGASASHRTHRLTKVARTHTRARSHAERLLVKRGYVSMSRVSL